MRLSGSSDVVRTKFSNLSVAIECGTGKAFGVSAFLDPYVATEGKDGTRFRGKKDILTKVIKDSVQYW